MLWHNYPTRTHHSSDLELKNTSREKHENSFKLFWKWKPDIFIIAAEMCAGSAVIMLSVCAHLHAGLPPLVTWNHHPVWQAFTFPSLYASVPWLAHTPLEHLQLYKAAAFFFCSLKQSQCKQWDLHFFFVCDCFLPQESRGEAEEGGEAMQKDDWPNLSPRRRHTGTLISAWPASHSCSAATSLLMCVLRLCCQPLRACRVHWCYMSNMRHAWTYWHNLT